MFKRIVGVIILLPHTHDLWLGYDSKGVLWPRPKEDGSSLLPLRDPCDVSWPRLSSLTLLAGCLGQEGLPSQAAGLEVTVYAP